MLAFTFRDYLIVLRDFSRLLKYISFLFIPPSLVAGMYGEHLFWVFALEFICLWIAGISAEKLFRTEGETAFRHAFVLVGMVWICISLLASVPFLCYGTGFVNALFESVSALTTTGFTVLDPDNLPRSLLFWRSFMQWVGGIGIVVAVLGGVFRISGFAFYIAEAREERIKPNIVNTVKVIWKIYIFYTLLGVVMLYVFGMPPFDAVNHAMTAIATGGMSTGDISHYSTGVHAVMILLMLVGATSFYTHYLLFNRRFGNALKDVQLIFMIILVLLSSFLLALKTDRTLFENLFHTVSAVTCTGFSLSPLSALSDFSKFLLIVLMVVGGAAGSTAGGIKIIRLIVILKSVKLHVKKLLMPNLVEYPKIGGKTVEEGAVKNACVFVFTYLLFIVLGSMFLTFMDYSLVDSLFEVASAQGNVGLSVGIADKLPAAGKLVLIINMLLGRLEIWALLTLLPIFKR